LRAFRTQFADVAEFIRENKSNKVKEQVQEKLTTAVKTFNETWS
jgi:hypothetical protein